MIKLVAYYRVSTRKQGDSGLGLQSQRTAVLEHARKVGGKILGEYTEVESGRKSNRAQFRAALGHARNTGATLCIAKLDRLARNVLFTATLQDSKQPFVCCDNPYATEFTIHILAAVAQLEAKQISERTVAALAAYKAGKRVSKRITLLYPKGVPAKVVRETAGKLGGALPQCRTLTPEAGRKGSALGIEAVAAKVAERVATAGPIVLEMRRGGMTLRAIAEALTGQGYITRGGKPWSAVAVLRMLNRIENKPGG
jgi:DNA invertase Pin-like site-specific DNA recombinase